MVNSLTWPPRFSTSQPSNRPLASNAMFQSFALTSSQSLPTAPLQPTHLSGWLYYIPQMPISVLLVLSRHLHSYSTFFFSYQLSRPHSPPMSFSLKIGSFICYSCLSISALTTQFFPNISNLPAWVFPHQLFTWPGIFPLLTITSTGRLLLPVPVFNSLPRPVLVFTSTSQL